MRRYVPRVLLAAVVAVSAACAASGPYTPPDPTDGGRYRVLVPALGGQEGDQIAAELRELITANLATHTAVTERELEHAKSHFEVGQLTEITARQLAQQMNAQLVAWGTVDPSGTADVKFIDVRSGDEIILDDITAPSRDQLAQTIFTKFEQSVQGIRKAAFCNDYLSSQQYEKALEVCNEALAIVPRSTSALYGKATALVNLEQYPEALTTYQKLLEIDPTHQDALLGAGLAASNLEQSDLAMGFYNRYLELNPGNVDVRITVANDIAQAGDYISAFRVLEPAIVENQDDVDFQKYLFSIATAAGQEATELGNEAEAQEFFTTALGAYDAAFTTGEAELTASTLKQAVAVYNELGRQQEALQLAQEATAQFGTDAGIWSQYATVLTDAGQHAEAARALTRVIELDPEYKDAYIRRALAYMEAGQRQQSEADLRVAAERGDRANVAQVLYKMGADELNATNYTEAVRLLSMAHDYAAGNMKSDVAFFWGYSLYKQGETIAKANAQGNPAQARRALEFFQKALPLVQASSHAQADQVVSAAQQYIENQQAIIQAGR